MVRFSQWHKQVTEVLKQRKPYFQSKCTIRFQLLYELSAFNQTVFILKAAIRFYSILVCHVHVLNVVSPSDHLLI